MVMLAKRSPVDSRIAMRAQQLGLHLFGGAEALSTTGA
jgi:hypothetical protein